MNKGIEEIKEFERRMNINHFSSQLGNLLGCGDRPDAFYYLKRKNKGYSVVRVCNTPTP